MLLTRKINLRSDSWEHKLNVIILDQEFDILEHKILITSQVLIIISSLFLQFYQILSEASRPQTVCGDPGDLLMVCIQICNIINLIF